MAPEGAIVAGSDRGVFVNRLDGGPWERLGSGPSPPQAISLAYDESSRRLFAGTAGGGVFEYSFVSISPELAPKPARVERHGSSVESAGIRK
jgi:hypothetical protein